MRFTFAEQEETEPELSEAQKRKLLVWKEYTSSSGQPFWYNKFTKETSWRDPLSVECDDLQWRTMQALETAARTNATILLQDLPDGWVQRQSRSKGFVYYQDIFTGQRSWDQPKRQLLCQNPLDELGGLLTIDIIEQSVKATTKRMHVYRPIPIRVTSGTSSDLLAGQQPLGDDPKAKVTEYIIDASRNDKFWRLKPETAVPRKNEHLRAEIIYEEKDSRGWYRGTFLKSDSRP